MRKHVAHSEGAPPAYLTRTSPPDPGLCWPAVPRMRKPPVHLRLTKNCLLDCSVLQRQDCPVLGVTPHSAEGRESAGTGKGPRPKNRGKLERSVLRRRGRLVVELLLLGAGFRCQSVLDEENDLASKSGALRPGGTWASACRRSQFRTIWVTWCASHAAAGFSVQGPG